MCCSDVACCEVDVSRTEFCGTAMAISRAKLPMEIVHIAIDHRHVQIVNKATVVL